jgi:hypothetical protein
MFILLTPRSLAKLKKLSAAKRSLHKKINKIKSSQHFGFKLSDAKLSEGGKPDVGPRAGEPPKDHDGPSCKTVKECKTFAETVKKLEQCEG